MKFFIQILTLATLTQCVSQKEFDTTKKNILKTNHWIGNIQKSKEKSNAAEPFGSFNYFQWKRVTYVLSLLDIKEKVKQFYIGKEKIMKKLVKTTKRKPYTTPTVTIIKNTKNNPKGK